MPGRRATRLRGACASGARRRRRDDRRGDRRRARSGSWSAPGRRLRSDPAAAQIEGGPGGQRRLRRVRGARGRRAAAGLRRASAPTADAGAARFGPDAGLVAATRRYEGPPVWVVTGARPAAVRGGGRAARRRRPARPLRGGGRSGDGDAAAAAGAMRSPFAYIAAAGPLQSASAGRRGRLPRRACRRRLPLLEPAGAGRRGLAAALAGLLAGARAAVRAALRMGLALALLIVVVNGAGRRPRRDGAGAARRLAAAGPGRRHRRRRSAAGAVIGLRAAVAMVAFAVYSACVDPDRVLRALRPLAGALGADRDAGLAAGAGRGGRRARACATRRALRGPGAAAVGRGALARRLLAGSLDRAVDVAATLELRGYSLDAPRGRRAARAARATTAASTRSARPSLVAAIARRGSLGADDFHTYPTVEVGLGAGDARVCAVLVALSRAGAAAGARPRPRRRASRSGGASEARSARDRRRGARV